MQIMSADIQMTQKMPFSSVFVDFLECHLTWVSFFSTHKCCLHKNSILGATLAILPSFIFLVSYVTRMRKSMMATVCKKVGKRRFAQYYVILVSNYIEIKKNVLYFFQ